MDLWDVVKVMARRWYITVPMVVLTLCATLFIGLTVKPSYVASGHISLLPPSVRTDAAIGQTQKVNPWSTDTLTGAVITRLRNKTLHDQLKAEGFLGAWEVDTDLRYSSIITIKVTAATPAQARTTNQKLVQIVVDEVGAQQRKFALRPGEEITAVRFDSGDNVETESGTVKRAMLAAFGAGLILTTALTMGLDALLRWRARRRAAANPVEQRLVTTMPSAAVAPTSPAPDTNGTRPVPHEVVPMVGIRYLPVADRPSTEGTEVIAVVVPEDATIVLPLSNAPWVGRDGAGSNEGRSNKARKR